MKFDREKLPNVLPDGSLLDLSDVSPFNSVISRNQSVNPVVVTNRHYRSLCQFGVRRLAVSVSAFACHVVRVVLHRAAFQVSRIAARRVVAFEVANNFVGNIFAGFDREQCSVRQQKLIVIEDSPVAVVISAASPKPTVIRFVYLFVKSVTKRTILLSFLIARIRAIFHSTFLRNERFSTSRAGRGAVDLLRFKFALIGAEPTLRCSKRKELGRAYLAYASGRRAWINHTSIVTQNASYLEVSA